MTQANQSVLNPTPIRLLSVLFILAIGLHIAAITLIINAAAWPGPVLDFWGVIPFLEQAQHYGWFNESLWHPSNAHRLVLSRLAFLIDHQFFHASNTFLVATGIIAILIQAVCYLVISTQNTLASDIRHLLALLAISVLTIPTVSFNLLHTFNAQWQLCACFALLAITLCYLGLTSKKSSLLYAGLACAILCSFTTFTLTAIWPALLLLALLCKVDRKNLLILFTVSILYSLFFVFVLPSTPQTEMPVSSTVTSLFDASIWQILSALYHYLIHYFAFPDSSFGSISATLSLLSLIWFTIQLTSRFRQQLNGTQIIALSAMAFCICLALTTALGRAYLGDIAFGPRFQPIALLYWASFFLLILSKFFNQTSQPRKGLIALTLAFVWLAMVSIPSTTAIADRLGNDHNRFMKAKVAYATGNLHPNAVFENVVPEWRAINHKGIIESLPYLQQNQLGIYQSPLAAAVKLPADTDHNLPHCVDIRIIEKPRGQDPKIRNLVINATEAGDQIYPYLLFYHDSKIIAGAFSKSFSPFKAQPKKPQWLGISQQPLTGQVSHAIAISTDGEHCQANIKNIKSKS